MALSDTEIRSLYANKDKRKGKRGAAVNGNTGKYLDADGWHDGRPKNPSEMYGSFIGRVGSTTRSRKGVTRRAPNGSRKYSQPLGFWQADAGDKDARPILAYKL